MSRFQEFHGHGFRGHRLHSFSAASGAWHHLGLPRFLAVLLAFSACLATSAETPPILQVEPLDLPYRTGMGRVGFVTLPAGAPGHGERLIEFGTLAERVVLSEIVGLREDGLVRSGEIFTELSFGSLAVARLEEPFVVLAGNRAQNNVITRTIEVRSGPGLAQSRLMFPEWYNDVRDIALFDPVSPDDFHYLLATPFMLHMMSSKQDEPLWERPVDSAQHAVSIRPDPEGPIQLLVSTSTQLQLLDPETGDLIDSWPISASMGLQVARLTGNGEQVVVAGPHSQGIIAFDLLAGEPLWSLPNSFAAGLHAHDLKGDGRDEVLLIRDDPEGGYNLIEWRDGSGALLHQASFINGFKHAVIFDILGTGQPQILLDSGFGPGTNPILSIDLQTRLDQARAEPSNHSRFHARRTEDGSLTLETVPGMQSNPWDFFEPMVRSVAVSDGSLNWISELEPDLNRNIQDITGLHPGEPAWQFGSVYILSRSGNTGAADNRITEIEAATGQILRRRVIDLGDHQSVHRLMALDLADGARLLLVSRGSNGTRFHLMSPQFLQVEWSSPSLPLPIADTDFHIQLADESQLLISVPVSEFNGTRLLDLHNGEVLYDPGPGIIAAALMRDETNQLLVLAQNSQRELSIHDPTSGEVTWLATLGFDLTAMVQARPTALLLAETDRLHVFDLGTREVVCSSSRQGAGLGLGRGFVRDPTRQDRWLIGNRAGVHALALGEESWLFHDRFEASDSARGCPWQ